MGSPLRVPIVDYEGDAFEDGVEPTRGVVREAQVVRLHGRGNMEMTIGVARREKAGGAFFVHLLDGNRLQLY